MKVPSLLFQAVSCLYFYYSFYFHDYVSVITHNTDSGQDLRRVLDSLEERGYSPTIHAAQALLLQPLPRNDASLHSLVLQ